MQLSTTRGIACPESFEGKVKKSQLMQNLLFLSQEQELEPDRYWSFENTIIINYW